MSEDDKDKEIKNPLAIAEELRNTLRNTDIVEHREQLVEDLKNVFIASRMETASLQEQLRATAIMNLLEKVQEGKMSTSQLLRVVEMAGQSGEKDLSSITGNGKGGINIYNNPQTANIGNGLPAPKLESKEGGNPVQDTGFLLDAVASVVKKLQDPNSQDKINNIIDITPEEEDND